MKTLLLCLHLAFAAYQGDTFQSGGSKSQATPDVREDCLECAKAFESGKKLCKMALKKKWYQVTMPDECLNKMNEKSALNCRNDVMNHCKTIKKPKLLTQYQYQQNAYQQAPLSQYQQPGVEVYADNQGSEVETEWERCIEAIADLQLQQQFDHLGDPTHLEKQTANGILTFRFRDGLSTTFQENGPGMLPSLQSCDIPPGSAVQMRCVPQPPQPEIPQYPTNGMSQIRQQGQPGAKPPAASAYTPPRNPNYKPPPPPPASQQAPSKPKQPEHNGQQGYGGGPYSPQQNGGNFGNNGQQNGGGYMNNQPQNGGGFHNGPQHGGNFGNNGQNGGNWNSGPPQNGGNWNNGPPQNGGNWNNGPPQHGGNWNNGPPQHGGNWNNGPQGQNQWGQNNGPQHGGFGGNNQGFNGGGFGGNMQGGGGPGSQGGMGAYGPSQLTVAEFETLWEDAMAAATPAELKALGVTLDDLEVFDEPMGVTEQVVQGMNYNFEFEDGTHIIVNEQSFMDPPVLKIMEIIPPAPANGGGPGGPGGRPRLSRTHIVDKDESSVNKLLIFTMILWGLVVGIIAGLSISHLSEKCYKKAPQEDMYIDLTLHQN